MRELDQHEGGFASESSVEKSTLELLNAEVEFLQRELQQRDQTIAELQTPESVTETVMHDIAQDRLQEMLHELQHADERISRLEHELRLLEELRVAEDEEKRQIESWVNEIELRIARREEENEVEIRLLRGKLEGESRARVETQKRVDASLGEGGDERLKLELSHVRSENEELRSKNEEAFDICRKLEGKLNVLRDTTSEAAVDARIEDALRGERLKLAQERAVISRREHELAKKLQELQTHMDMESKVRNKTNEADERFRVFRERLRELHEEEAAEYKPPSVGERLIKMWRNLDGPTDVD